MSSDLPDVLRRMYADLNASWIDFNDDVASPGSGYAEPLLGAADEIERLRRLNKTLYDALRAQVSASPNWTAEAAAAIDDYLEARDEQ